jgi:hypothetical protein
MIAGKKLGIMAIIVVAAIVGGIGIIAMLAINYAQETDIQDSAPGTFVGDEGPPELSQIPRLQEDYPASIAQISVTPNVTQAGSQVTIRGADFVENSEVVILLNNDPLETTPATVVTDGAGIFTAKAQLPAAPGEYIVAASGENDRAATAGILIVSRQDPAP